VTSLIAQLEERAAELTERQRAIAADAIELARQAVDLHDELDCLRYELYAARQDELQGAPA
jgi:hypothetical protein